MNPSEEICDNVTKAVTQAFSFISESKPKSGTVPVSHVIDLPAGKVLLLASRPAKRLTEHKISYEVIPHFEDTTPKVKESLASQLIQAPEIQGLSSDQSTSCPVQQTYLLEKVVKDFEQMKPGACSLEYIQEEHASLSASLAESLRTGIFVDTKFYAYSQRSRKGRAKLPLSIFANSDILRASSLLLRNKLENIETSQTCIIEVADGSILGEAEYSYECDSDLDEEEDRADISGIFEDDDYYVGDKSETECSYDSWEDTASSSTKTSSSKGSTLLSSANTSSYMPCRTLLVKDYAFKTWQALIYYLYTGDIAFSNLKSEKSTPSKNASSPFPCSPKSMYRLACKLGLSDLKDRAFESIRSKITKYNIVEEVFSKFTSQYPAIRAMELRLLGMYANSSEAKSALPPKFNSIARGDLPHCADVLTKAFLEMADGKVPKF